MDQAVKRCVAMFEGGGTDSVASHGFSPLQNAVLRWFYRNGALLGNWDIQQVDEIVIGGDSGRHAKCFLTISIFRNEAAKNTIVVFVERIGTTSWRVVGFSKVTRRVRAGDVEDRDVTWAGEANEKDVVWIA